MTVAVDRLEEVFEHLRRIAERSRAATAAHDRAAARAAVDDYGRLNDDTLAVVGTVQPADVDGIPCEWYLPAGSEEPVHRLLYIHGGAWTAGSLSSHRPLAARLAQATGCATLGVAYRLAPEHPFPAGLEDCIAVYRWLRELQPGQTNDPGEVFVAGDSAGGNLTLALLLALKRFGDPLPAAAAVLSPATDFTASGDSVKTRADRDPIIEARNVPLIKKAYAPDTPAEDPLLSPLFGDLVGLPPLLIQVGDAETLLDDSVRFAGKAKGSGVDVTLEVWPDMPHVWHCFAPYLPEATQAIDRIGEFVKNRCA